MATMLDTITADPGRFMFIVFVGGRALLGICAIGMVTFGARSSTRARDDSHREIAAHIVNDGLSSIRELSPPCSTQ